MVLSLLGRLRLGVAYESGGHAIFELGRDDGEHGGQVRRHADRLGRAHHQTHGHEAHAVVRFGRNLVQNAARRSRARAYVSGSDRPRAMHKIPSHDLRGDFSPSKHVNNSKDVLLRREITDSLMLDSLILIHKLQIQARRMFLCLKTSVLYTSNYTVWCSGTLNISHTRTGRSKQKKTQ